MGSPFVVLLGRAHLRDSRHLDQLVDFLGNYFATLKSKRNKRADEEVEEKRSCGGGRSSGSWVLVGLYLWRVAWE
jgi:hypothetical protein